MEGDRRSEPAENYDKCCLRRNGGLEGRGNLRRREDQRIRLLGGTRYRTVYPQVFFSG